jgi:hypothetical protein
MKISKIACVLLIFFISGLIAESCLDCNEQTFTCSISSLRLASLDEQKEYFEIAEDRPVSRDHYGIRIDFDVETQIAECRRHGAFMQSAHAMGQCRDYYTYNDSIASIRIFSNRDFGDSFPAGADISEAFKVLRWKATYNPTTQQIGNDTVFFPIANYLNRLYISIESDISPFDCKLVTLPDAGEYTFTVVAALSDGRELEQSIKVTLE